ncbi:MAG: hypothetical protein JXB20_06595 [Bacilli bacterium]|nr:hypothetical protein [Bacilli bacterium]
MKNEYLNLLKITIISVGIIGTAMIFFPALAFPNSETQFLGYEVAFGTVFVDYGGFASGQIMANILAFLAYLLPVTAVLVFVFFKKGVIISMVMFAIAVVLLLLLPVYTTATVTLIGNTIDLDIDWVVSYGMIVAVVCGVIGTLAGLYLGFLEVQRVR